jgi:hypothetical protein
MNKQLKLHVRLNDVKGSLKKRNRLYAVTYLDDQNNNEFLQTQLFAARSKAQLRKLVREEWLDNESDLQYGMDPSMRLSNQIYFDNNMWDECVLHEHIGSI